MAPVDRTRSTDEAGSVLWPDHCVQNTPGCELIPELDKSTLHLIVDKGQDPKVESYSGFGPPFKEPKVSMTSLQDSLRNAGITEVFVVGLALDYCVKHTAIDAAKEGFKTYLVEEATKAVDQSEQALAACRTEMHDAGVLFVDLHSEELQSIKAG